MEPKLTVTLSDVTLIYYPLGAYAVTPDGCWTLQYILQYVTKATEDNLSNGWNFHHSEYPNSP
jgi:hypothetical protein